MPPLVTLPPLVETGAPLLALLPSVVVDVASNLRRGDLNRVLLTLSVAAAAGRGGVDVNCVVRRFCSTETAKVFTFAVEEIFSHCSLGFPRPQKWSLMMIICALFELPFFRNKQVLIYKSVKLYLRV